LANLYGYVPNYIKAATALVSVQNTSASTIVIPADTAFISTDGQQFLSVSENAVLSLATSTLSVIQGKKYTSEAVTSESDSTSSSSNGTPGQRFRLYRTGVAVSTIKTYVREGTFGEVVEWVRVNNLTKYGPNDSVFTVYITPTGITQIVFGNGINGRIPANNSAITCTYIQTSGSAGNVAAGTINRFVSGGITGISIVGNTFAASGGSDIESIDSIKRAIPSVIRTRNGAVSLSDFEDLALTTQGVSKAHVSYLGSGSTGASVTATVIGTQATYLTDGAASVSIPTDLRERVSRELLDSAMLGITLINVPSTVTFTKLYIYLDLYVKSNYVQSVVSADVSNAIDTLFSFDNVLFGGQTITIGDVYRVATAVNGVDYVVVTGFNPSDSNSIASSGKLTIASDRLLKKGSVNIVNYGGVSAV
jgi:predicted phage baseplate assembly protein